MECLEFNNGYSYRFFYILDFVWLAINRTLVCMICLYISDTIPLKIVTQLTPPDQTIVHPPCHSTVGGQSKL